MSATDLLILPAPTLRESVLQSDATTVDAFYALLECHDMLAANPGAAIPGATSTRGADQFEELLRRKLGQIDAPRAVQDFAYIIDTHLADLEFARQRAVANGFSGFAVEQLFLQIQSHPSNGDLDAYLQTYSVQLWNALMPSHLPDTLVHAILTPILKSTCTLLSTPWVLHSAIIALYGLPVSLGAVKQSESKYTLKSLLKKNGPSDTNPFIRNLLYRLGGRSIGFKVLKVLWLPLDRLVSILLNRIVTNIFGVMFPLELPAQNQPLKEYLLSLRDMLLLQDHHDPGLEEQQRLRKQAMDLVPKFLGSPVLPDYVFDYYLVNQRLVVSAMDLLLELVKHN